MESSLEYLVGERQDIAPYIGSLYALDYPEIAEVSPEFWKAELQKAVLMILTALARRTPTVICLEDLHWADPSSIELVHFLLSEIRQPVLFIGVYRPTISLFSTHQIDDLAITHQELQLQDLSPSEAQNMVESLLKTKAIPKDLRQFIKVKVEGNPFYLEEAVNSLIESNILISENGGWKVSGLWFFIIAVISKVSANYWNSMKKLLTHWTISQNQVCSMRGWVLFYSFEPGIKTRITFFIRLLKLVMNLKTILSQAMHPAGCLLPAST